MREIKFRVWDKDDNKIYKVDGFINNFPFIDWNYDDDFEEYSIQDHYIVKNGEVMQYTGIKDRNGKEIYEGDIFISDNNNKYEVTFIDGGFKLSNMKYPNQNLGLLDRMTSNYGEVIGNIYENKDLLEK